MALNARNYKQESKFADPEPLAVGTYPARIVRILDLGLQAQRPYKGQDKDPKDMIDVTYELVDEFLLDEEGNELTDKPRWVSEDFTMNSLESDLAKSTKRYAALDPDMKHNGDWAQLIGTACMVSIVQNEGKGKNEGRIFNNVSSVQSMRAKDADKVPALVNEGKIFDTADPDMEIFMSLPTYMQDKIKENLDYGGSVLEKAVESYKEPSKGGSDQESSKVSKNASQEVSDTSESDDEDW